MQSHLSRRAFLGMAGGGLALAAFPGRLSAASDQIVLGMIGVGSMGTGRLEGFLEQSDVRIGAICDVDKRHADRAAALVEKVRGYKPPVLGDFRRVLDMKEVDAVAVVTPDHWHAIPAVRAFDAGKDVFVEKPLSYSVAEGRAMAEASLAHKRVSQMGNHIHNTGGNYRRAVELVRSGKLGKITRVHLWKTGPDADFTTTEPATKPPELDYDFWQGPAPKRPYEALRSHFTFRYFWDYSGGMFIDFWCHIADLAYWALDLKAPLSVSSAGGKYFLKDTTETPDTLEAVYEYPGGLILNFSICEKPPAGFAHIGGIGALFEGTEASLVANYETQEVWVKGKKIDDFPRPPATIAESPGHLREFLDAIKSRNLETTCNVRYGHRLSKAGLLGNIAYRTGRRIYWDDATERIKGDSEASRYLAREFRKPWKLKA